MDEQLKKRNKYTVQIKTEISIEDAERLDKIVKEYNFKSRYQVIRYLTECFIKVADPKPDEVVNEDLRLMFGDSTDWGDHNNTKRRFCISTKEVVAPKDVCPVKKKFVDKYINENYNRLEAKFRTIDNFINEKSISALDKLNETIEHLYSSPQQFEKYEDFEKWANKNKFTAKKDR